MTVDLFKIAIIFALLIAITGCHSSVFNLMASKSGQTEILNDVQLPKTGQFPEWDLYCENSDPRFPMKAVYRQDNDRAIIKVSIENRTKQSVEFWKCCDACRESEFTLVFMDSNSRMEHLAERRPFIFSRHPPEYQVPVAPGDSFEVTLNLGNFELPSYRSQPDSLRLHSVIFTPPVGGVLSKQLGFANRLGCRVFAEEVTPPLIATGEQQRSLRD